jgi:cyclopropane fatty-acyl-phospholipid synthase-like methyltransferase
MQPGKAQHAYFSGLIQRMFTNQQVRDYYDQTETHYRFWWNLEESMALHYGLWLTGTHSFTQALHNLNIAVAAAANIQQGERVLDAGCGVGGSSIFLAKTFGCHCTGISLSEKQIARAHANSQESGLENQLDFRVADYTKTGLPDASFDVVWSIEAHVTETNKAPYFAEAARLLKPGGRLVVADYFTLKEERTAAEQFIMQNWLHHWAINDIASTKKVHAWMEAAGLKAVSETDITEGITPSSRRMYYACQAGKFGTWLYNLVYNATPFSKTHYKSGIYQYKALKSGLWAYKILVAQKQSGSSIPIISAAKT